MSGSGYGALALPSGTLTLGTGITVEGGDGYLGYSPEIGGSTSNITVVNQGTIQANASGGTITIDASGAAFQNFGTVNASAGAINISTGSYGIVNSGTLAAGPTGTLSITGPFTQSSTGNFNEVLGGSAPGLYGQTSISGTASLNGSLDVILINGYTPSQGSSFAILTFTSETGNFSAENGLYFGGGEAFNPTFTPINNPTALDLVVVAENATTQTTVQSSENPSNYGDTVTFTATVTPTVSTNLTPTGTVTFFDGASDLGSATLVNGSATLATTTLAGGSQSIAVQYDGDSNFSGSNSSPLTQTVNPIASETTLQSSENPADYGDSVTFTATVSSSSSTPGLVAPSGKVEFFDGSTHLDTETLSGGSASFTTSSLGVGANQQIEASYLGDTNYNPSNVTIQQTVNPPPPPATLDGEIYNDPNDSGTPVSGSGLSGWTVTLMSGSTPVATTTTDSSGDYSFANVAPGSYTVSVTEQSGYAPTVPASGSLAVTAPGGQTVSNLNFGEFQTVTVSGETYDDVSGSGILNAHDPALAGWSINLLNGSNEIVQTATTDSNGDYSFSGVGPGTYSVAEVLQSGYAETSSPSTYSLTTTGGQDVSGLDFGNFQQWSVSGTLFEDSNQDGTLDHGDPVLSGWTVHLLNSSTQIIASDTTDSNGLYTFSGAGPGTYTIEAVLQAGYVQTTPASGSFSIIASSGAQFSGENFGVYKVVSLAVSGLTTAPSSGLQSSESLVVEWTETNTGTSAAIGSFYDQIVVTNTTTGQQLASGFVQYNAATLGNLAAGASAPQQYDFTLPNGNPGVGQIQFTVTADYYGDVSTSQGETSNVASVTETSTLASYPELSVSDVSAVSTASPGQQVSVGWTLANIGAASASGPWTEQVLLATDATGDNQTLLTAQTFTGSLAAGQSFADSANVLIPSLPPGNYWLVVSEDPFGELFELNASNNLAISADPTSIAGSLTLTLSPTSVSDAAGADATTATVTRNTDTTNALQVTITNSDTHDVTAPQTVTIPAGATSATFPVGTIDNDVVEGTQTATLTASATGLVSGSDTLTVTDTNVPTLTLTLNTHTVSETDPNPAATGTVTRNTPTTSALTVSLVSNDINKLTVPATVTIPAGATSATFPVAVVNDQQIDGDVTTTITASAAGYVTGSDSVDVIDDNVPALTLTLADQTVSEAAGADATTDTVSIASAASQPITITLSSSDTAAATVPASVVIGAGQTSASFPIAAIDDGLDLGDKTAVIMASVETDAGVIVNQGSTSAALLLKEADGPALTVSFAGPTVEKGAMATATITRNTVTSDALVVTLASSDPTKASVPPTVTIPAGEASVSFTINAIDDHTPDGLQQVQIFASATGLDTGIASLGITDVDLPDLVVSSVTAPTNAYDNAPLSISWTVTNSGEYPASGSWLDQVYLDPVGGPQSATPADTVAFDGTVNAGRSYVQTDTLPSPSTVGQYIVRIVTDSGQSVQELSFANNTGVAAQPLNDQAAYSVTVSPSATTVSSGTPVVLSGVATLTSNDAPAADVPVAVQILVSGTTRTLTGTTDASGDYSVTFQPLPDEAGEYSVTAADPGVTNPPIQAQFEIVGMSATPANRNVSVVPNTPLTGTFTLANLSETTLTGLTATATGGPAGLTVQLTPPSQITGDGTATLDYSLDTTSAQAATGVVTIQVATAQGAVLDIPLGVSVLPLTPVLAVNPGFLSSGMAVGTQSLITFAVVNNGGAPSGDLQVSLPTTPYMTLASPTTISSLAPGASSTVTIELSPASNLPLDQYTGTIAVAGAQTGISVPFTFTAITTAVGSVHVLVDDDYTFDETGAPHVVGATVSLLDPFDNTDVVATGVTDATGAITFTNIPAGPYVLEVQASGHSTYENSYTVVAGITNNVEPFISRQFVTYTWNVVQTTIQDTYQIQLETDFVTNVPAPVVTISAPSSIPTLAPGQSGTFNVTITNHGLIAAQGVTLTLPTDAEYTFTALSTNIGVVPAESSVIVPITVTRAAPQPVSTSDGGAVLTTKVEVPNPIGAHVSSTLYVDYSNTGTAPMPAPLLVLTATQNGNEGAWLTLNPTLQVAGYNTSAAPAGYSQSVEILASGATPGVLEPGESVQVPVYYVGWNSLASLAPEVSLWSTATPVKFSLTTLTADNTTAANWSSLLASAQPQNIPAAAWSTISTTLEAQLGATSGGYVQLLDNEASSLGSIGENINDVQSLWGFAIQQADNALNPLAPFLASATDDSVATPGSLSLSFARVFAESISGRDTMSTLGMGWSASWQTSASVASDGTVTISEPGGSQRVFQPDSRTAGAYFSEPGDTNTLSADGHGGYLLTESDGIATDYRSSGLLNYLQDTDGNRITAGYTTGQLTSLTASSGQYIAISYNAAGLIASIADSAGRTTTYNYDPTNTYLTSVNGFNGQTTNYTYDTSGDAAENALQTITIPGGTHQYFAYDSLGRLAGISQDGGAEPETFAYSFGQVTTTDGTGDKSETYYNENGLVAESVDALGNPTFYSYDSSFNLVKITNAAGASEAYAYNAAGEVTSSTDFLGYTTNFAYSGPFNELSSMTDAKGNTTQYKYNSTGDLLNTTYADGSSSSSTFNPEGEATSFLNANGQPIHYMYNRSRTDHARELFRRLLV